MKSRNILIIFPASSLHRVLLHSLIGCDYSYNIGVYLKMVPPVCVCMNDFSSESEGEEEKRKLSEAAIDPQVIKNKQFV